MKNFKEQAPEKLVARMMVLEYIRQNAIPDDLEKMAPGTQMVEELFDESGEPAWFFNWEFMLFECPLPELDYMGTKIYNKTSTADHNELAEEGISKVQMLDELAKRKIQGDAWKGSDALGAMLDDFELKQKVDSQEKPKGQKQAEVSGAPDSTILAGKAVKPERVKAEAKVDRSTQKGPGIMVKLDPDSKFPYRAEEVKKETESLILDIDGKPLKF